MLGFRKSAMNWVLFVALSSVVVAAASPARSADEVVDSNAVAQGTSESLDGAPGGDRAGTSCQTAPDMFDYGPHRLDAEAEQLAMHFAGTLRAPDAEYDRILRDLQLIREAYPFLTAVVDEPDYMPNKLVLRLEAPGPWPNYEALKYYYQVTNDEIIIPSLDIHLLTFCDNLNAHVIGPEFAALADVRYAEPDYLVGWANRISIVVFATDYRYTILAGFHDCFDGCDCDRTWVLDVADDGTVGFVSYQEDDHGWSWCVFEDTACCLPTGQCSVMAIDQCQLAGGAPMPFDTVCEGDVDMDGLDGSCGDGCPADPDKTDPGECGCGVPESCAAGIPAVSEWGVAVMALLVLAAGTLVFRRNVGARASM